MRKVNRLKKAAVPRCDKNGREINPDYRRICGLKKVGRITY